MYIRDLDDLLWALDIFPTPIVVECEICGQLYYGDPQDVVYGTECCGRCWVIGNIMDVDEALIHVDEIVGNRLMGMLNVREFGTCGCDQGSGI